MGDTVASSKSKSDIEKILGVGAAKAMHGLPPWQIYAAAGAAILALALIGYYWLGGSSKSRYRYVSEAVTRGALTVIVTATGSIQPTNQVDVSSELSGTIKRVLVDFNSKVKVGQTLAELDTDKLKASVQSARAKLAAAEAKIKDAEATALEKRLEFERKQRLAARKVTTEHDLQAAQAAHARAVAAVASAKADAAAAAADLKLNETNLLKTCICSPINGVVLKRNVEPGQIVASSLQAPVLFNIAEDLTKMEVQVNVDEADIGKVKEGQTATFSVDAYPNRKFKAVIRELRLGSEVVQGVVTYKAILSTDNSDMLLRPGMTATSEITVQRVTDAISVPNAALRFSPPSNKTTDDRSFLQKILPGRPNFRAASARPPAGRERSVWLLIDGAPEERRITIGPSDGRRTQVLKGQIAAGDQVIVDATAAKKGQ
ncbi:MAG: efflux RND transporter periplasmic adaptor subunit [Hyphomicrobiaceae bacterium]|nr:efflux RND transporter periplasmic adaptor subunit [Hyphomicrobiaceae bacterium]